MNTPAGYIWLILLGLAKANTDEDFVVQLSRTKSSWGNIPHGCHPLLDLQKIREHMSNDTEVWLPIKRIDLKGWYWTNGKYFGTQISSKEWERQGMDCAVLRSLDKIIDDVYCERNYEHYICEGLQKCDEDNYMCLNTTLGVYNIYNQTGTWYDAIERCDHRKQSLAAIGNEHLQDILQLVAKRTSLWANIWLALRKREFRLFNSSTTIRLKTFDWGPSQPSSMKGHDCVYLNVSGNRSSWRTDSCHRPRKHICLYQGRSMPVTAEAGNNVIPGRSMPVTAEAGNNVIPGKNHHSVTKSEILHSTAEIPPSPSSNCTTCIVFIIILLIYALAASGMSVILLHKLKRKDKLENKDTEDQSTTLPLLDRRSQTEKPEPTKPPNNITGDPYNDRLKTTDKLEEVMTEPRKEKQEKKDTEDQSTTLPLLDRRSQMDKPESTEPPNNITGDPCNQSTNDRLKTTDELEEVMTEPKSEAGQTDIKETNKSSDDKGHSQMTMSATTSVDTTSASVKTGDTLPTDQLEQKNSNKEGNLSSRIVDTHKGTTQGSPFSSTSLKDNYDENKSSINNEDQIDGKDKTSSKVDINDSKKDQEARKLIDILAELAKPTSTTHYRVAQISRIIECNCTFQNVFGPWPVQVYYNSNTSCLVTDASYGGFFTGIKSIPAQLILIQSYDDKGLLFRIIMTKEKTSEVIFKDTTANITPKRDNDSKKITITVKKVKAPIAKDDEKKSKQPNGNTTKEEKGAKPIENLMTENKTDRTTNMKSQSASVGNGSVTEQNARPSISTFDVLFKLSDHSRDFVDIVTNFISLGSETPLVNKSQALKQEPS